ncbi:MAG TPA: hypothetical protein VLB90_02155, partial [Pseudomonadales bacterium]|nr:hypothetical protein [Pseudomonadales bacterium]
ASLQAGDYSSLFCLLGNRAAFYLATYRPVNYLYYSIKNQLFTTTTQNVGDEDLWHRGNLDVQANVAPDPQGGMTADKMTVPPAQQYVETYVSPWAELPGNTDYTFSVWLWSDTPADIQLAITRRSDGLAVASTMAAITQQPRRFFVSAKTITAGEYNVTFGLPPSAADVHVEALPPAAFYAWGGQIDEGTAATEYRGGTYLARSVVLVGNIDYTFSVWLWSDTPTDIQLALMHTADDAVIATTMAAVTRQPQRFSITGRTTALGQYTVIIGSRSSGSTIRFGASPFDSFYIWHSQLEEGTAVTEYAGFEPVVGSQVRNWHVWLLLANGMALILMFLYIIRFKRIWLCEPAGLAVTAMAGAVFAEALAIIPEQRFCIAFMVLIWLFALGFTHTIVIGRHTQRLN